MANYAGHAKRGIRNNNAGNIERTKTKWVGMSSDQSSDSRYIVFSDAKYGIRALYRTLLTYRNQYGFKTPRSIITRWAPPHENDTPAYIAAVAKALNINADTALTSQSQYMTLIKSIVRQENGVQPYSDAEIIEGMKIA